MSGDPFDTSHYAEVDEYGIAELDRANQVEEPPAAASLSEWTPTQRLALYGAIDETAKLMERRAIRPLDPRVRTHLQRREQQRSAVTISAGASDIFRDKNASSFDKSTQAVQFEHEHIDTDTLIVDIRFLTRRLGPSVQLGSTASMMLPYICLSRNMQTSVCKSNEHTNIHRFFAARARVEATIGKLTADASLLFGLRLHSILIRNDATLELVFNLDMDGCFFAVVSCGQLSVHVVPNIVAQLQQEAKKEEARAEEPPVLGETAHDRDIEQLVAAKANSTSLDGPICFVTPDSAVPEQRLMALSTAVVVYSTNLSTLLLQQSVAPRYLYFVACQCLMGEEGVAAYEKAFAPS
jgi:hypothetical protein